MYCTIELITPHCAACLCVGRMVLFSRPSEAACHPEPLCGEGSFRGKGRARRRGPILEELRRCAQHDMQAQGRAVLPLHAECTDTGIGCRFAKLFFDAQQLIILGNPVGTGRRTGLDLAGIGRHYQIGNRDILGFARAM